jgi:hypothetical protein
MASRSFPWIREVSALPIAFLKFSFLLDVSINTLLSSLKRLTFSYGDSSTIIDTKIGASRGNRNLIWITTFDAANVPSVRLADDVPFEPVSTLQFFEVKISSEKWPLHVYGFIATRDSVDYKRNIIFERTRDDCQIIYEQVRVFCLFAPCLYFYLVLSSAEPFI